MIDRNRGLAAGAPVNDGLTNSDAMTHIADVLKAGRLGNELAASNVTGKLTRRRDPTTALTANVR